MQWVSARSPSWPVWEDRWVTPWEASTGMLQSSVNGKYFIFFIFFIKVTLVFECCLSHCHHFIHLTHSVAHIFHST